MLYLGAPCSAQDAAGGSPGAAPVGSEQGQIDGVFVRGDARAHFIRKKSNIIALGRGAIIVSVRPPAQAALVVTRLGRVKINGNSDALVGIAENAIKVQNLKGDADSVLVALNKELFSQADKPVALSPGKEFMALAAAPALPPGQATQAATPGTTINQYQVAAPGAHGGARAPAQAAPVERVARPSAGSYVVESFSPASLTATAHLISSIDRTIQNSDERRFYRDLIRSSAFMPVWHEHQHRYPAATEPGHGSGQGSKILPREEEKATGDDLDLNSPEEKSQGHREPAAISKEESVDSLLGDDKAASQKQPPQEKEDDLLGGSEKEREPSGPQGKHEDAFAGLFDDSEGPSPETIEEKELIGDWFGESSEGVSGAVSTGGGSDDLDSLFDVAGNAPHDMDIGDLFPE